ERLRVDQHRNQERSFIPSIHPRVIGPALHHDVEWLERHFALVENQGDFAIEKNDVINRARSVHPGATRDVRAAMLPADSLESRVAPGCTLRARLITSF